MNEWSRDSNDTPHGGRRRRSDASAATGAGSGSAAGNRYGRENVEGRETGSLDAVLDQDRGDQDRGQQARGGAGAGRHAPESIGKEPRERSSGGAKRAAGWLVALALIAMIAMAAWVGAREVLGLNYSDYDGAGESDVVIEVSEGDSTQAIASTLEAEGVVASTQAFLESSGQNAALSTIQPGYYTMKTEMSGEHAVDAITAPGARVGELEIQGGTQLDDITQPDDTVTPGVYSLISDASCAELDGQSTCVSPEELQDAATEADLTELGVPEWLAEPASEADPQHRLEGLILPGVYHVNPSDDAREILSDLLSSSMSKLESSGLPDSAESEGQDPYEVVTIASLIQHEAVENDFEQVSRVIHNRIDDGMRLEMDSTINYVLERPEVRTSSEDRERPGPYNTYLNEGLPPSPISAPGPEALRAAQNPSEGQWMFFVKCEENGLSCFADDYDEHRENVRDAQERGVY